MLGYDLTGTGAAGAGSAKIAAAGTTYRSAAIDAVARTQQAPESGFKSNT